MLHRIVAISTFSLLIATGALASDTQIPGENPDAACSSNIDCVAVEQGGCSGGWGVINKKHEAEYVKRARDMNSVIKCAKTPVFSPKPKIGCVKKLCAMKAKN